MEWDKFIKSIDFKRKDLDKQDIKSSQKKDKKTQKKSKNSRAQGSARPN